MAFLGCPVRPKVDFRKVSEANIPRIGHPKRGGFGRAAPERPASSGPPTDRPVGGLCRPLPPPVGTGREAPLSAPGISDFLLEAEPTSLFAAKAGRLGPGGPQALRQLHWEPPEGELAPGNPTTHLKGSPPPQLDISCPGGDQACRAGRGYSRRNPGP